MRMIDQIAEAIGNVYIFCRYNDFTEDRVKGLPVEICKYGDGEKDEIIVIKRFSSDADMQNALEMVKNQERAMAALEAMKEPSDAMISEGEDVPIGAFYLGRNNAKNVFAAMIDAALNE